MKQEKRYRLKYHNLFSTYFRKKKMKLVLIQSPIGTSFGLIDASRDPERAYDKKTIIQRAIQ